MAKAQEGPGEALGGLWSLCKLFPCPVQYLWMGGWSSPGPLRALSLKQSKISLKLYGKPSPTLPVERGALSQERGARPLTHLLPVLAMELPGQPWQAGPLPGGAGGRGAEQGPWCLALCQSCSSCCYRCPDTAVPMSAPLLPQELWSGTD